MKYTFEIMKEYEDAFKGISVYSVSEDKKLMVDFVAIEELEDAQKEIDEAYQRGLDDAWEAARKIVTWPDRSLINSDTFDLDPGESIFTKYSASEAIAKLKAYEEQQKADDEIKVGDVVMVCTDSNKYTFVVTKVNDESVWGVDADGSWNFWDINDVTKTDKHYNIDKILEEMRE